MLGQVRPYDPVAPPPDDTDITKYPLKLVTVVKDENKRGWARYKISINNELRARYMSDPLFGGQWRDLIMDFDKKLLSSH